MKAVLLDGFGGREVLKLGKIETPSAVEGQVLIRVMATSVNRADIVQREGNYPPPKGDSEILGLEVAGTIEALGPGVSGWKRGDRVMSLVGGGGYAGYAVAYANHLISIPEAMSFEQAACICETYITAYLNVFMIGGLKDHESVLLHGGGGGVNSAAVQLCKSLVPTAKVVVTASPQKVERVKQLGADLVIDYKVQDFAEEVKAYTDNKGVDVILDHIGAKYLAPNMAALASKGRLVVIGVMGGAKAELNIGLMMVKRLQLIGSVLRARPVAEKARITAEFTKIVLPKLADRTLVPLIHATLSLDDVAKAHEMMEAGTHFGNIVLRVASDK
ncbi:MAG: NAD(P)H-quinone oxidoreductase [Gammaproteobacteria bacterium]|nr:NAD(P)H-quinone oxidoreductase [Gammaproteobacteria bacterium]